MQPSHFPLGTVTNFSPMMRLLGQVIIIGIILGGVPWTCTAVPERLPKTVTPVSTQAASPSPSNTSCYQGWDYLATKLIRDGIPSQRLCSLFGDARMPPYEHVEFSLEPKDSPRFYQIFFKPARIAEARLCLRTYTAELQKAEERFGVDRHLITAMLFVESHCGKALGSSLVFHRLARLASIAAPDNITYNKRLHRGSTSSRAEAKHDQVEKRARALEEMFYPEILALLELAARENIDLFELRGSAAGAFGIPQFLPSSYLIFGIDGDGDGKISLFSLADAAASTANFLSSFGWRNDAPLIEQRQVIWKYNHSIPYVDTILKLKAILEK